MTYTAYARDQKQSLLLHAAQLLVQMLMALVIGCVSGWQAWLCVQSIGAGFVVASALVALLVFRIAKEASPKQAAYGLILAELLKLVFCAAIIAGMILWWPGHLFYTFVGVASSMFALVLAPMCVKLKFLKGVYDHSR